MHSGQVKATLGSSDIRVIAVLASIIVYQLLSAARTARLMTYFADYTGDCADSLESPSW